MPTIFITSITGTQGRALADLALSLGWHVRGTSRDPSSPLVQSIIARGGDVLAGSWDDEAVLKSAVSGCDYLFLNLSPDYGDLTAEERQGRNILSLASEARVSHVVYSTTAALNNGPLPFDTVSDLGVQMMKGKSILEDTLRRNEYGFPQWTILRPAFFMANWLPPVVNSLFPGLTHTGTLKTAMRPDTMLALTDSADTAAFAAAAFQEPGKFNRQEIGVASDVKSLEETVKALGTAAGKDIPIVYMTVEEIGESREPGFNIQKAIADAKQENMVNMDDMMRWGVPRGSFEGFLHRERSAVAETYSKF